MWVIITKMIYTPVYRGIYKVTLKKSKKKQSDFEVQKNGA